VRAGAGSSLLDQLVDAVADEPLLLVVDNCEHVSRSAAALVSALIEGGNAVTVLATSRSPLGVDGELLWALVPLARHGGATAGADDAPAVRLFLDRVEAHAGGDLPDGLDQAQVHRVCELLDGVPLCLELAAARVRHMGLEGLVRALDDPETLQVVGDQDARHGSLRALIDWSFDRLSPSEQDLFSRLSVFGGWFDAHGARDVARPAAPLGAVVHDLSALVDHSMLRVDAIGGVARYSILVPLRQVGRQLLDERGEADEVRARHASWVLEAAAAADRALRGPAAPTGLARLDELLPELRLAHRFALERRDRDAVVRMCRSLYWFAQERSHADVLAWAEAALDHLQRGDDGRGTERDDLSIVHSCIAVTKWQQGGIEDAAVHADVALRTASDPVDRRWARLVSQEVCLLQGRVADGLEQGRLLELEADAVPPDLLLTTVAHMTQALLLAMNGDAEAAKEPARRCSEDAASCGSPLALAWAEYTEGECRLETEPELALEHLERALALARANGSRLLEGISALSVVSLRARTGDQPAWADFADVIEHWRRAGTDAHQWTTIRNLAELLARRGHDDASARLYGAVIVPTRGGQPRGAEATRLRTAMRGVRARLGEQRFEDLLTEGAALSDAETTTAALRIVHELDATG
jgi:predicted ATPase